MRIHPLQLSRHSSSLGVIVDSHLPHLICMDDDILSTGVVMYYLQVPVTGTLSSFSCTTTTDYSDIDFRDSLKHNMNSILDVQTY